MFKLGVIYGGMSTERDISVKSVKFILENLNREKYEVFPIFINKDGEWFEEENENKYKIENVFEYLKNMDIIFPMLHGKYGEDGTIQGLFEILKIKYVGCKVLASSVCLDKVYSKLIFDKAGINQAKYLFVKNYNNKYFFIDENFDEKVMSLDDICDLVKLKIDFPVFVKPSNSGSSFGVNKATNFDELKFAIMDASKYDNKIIIEEEIIGKEVECAVLGNSCVGVKVTEVGEIISVDDFYSFDAKYNNVESQTLIPAKITDEQKNKIQYYAKKAFNAIDGSGLSRVDFFIQEDTGKIIINEINTMPGMTSISMYPKLFEYYGYDAKELLDKLIEMEM